MLERLQLFLANHPDLEVAVLIGSRARGSAGEHSDWDFAIQWQRDQADFMTQLARTEQLRQALAGLLGCSAEQVDLVDLPSAGLAMRAAVAEEGIPLKGQDELPWFHFLSRTWRDLEDWYWERDHAA